LELPRLCWRAGGRAAPWKMAKGRAAAAPRARASGAGGKAAGGEGREGEAGAGGAAAAGAAAGAAAAAAAAARAARAKEEERARKAEEERARRALEALARSLAEAKDKVAACEREWERKKGGKSEGAALEELVRRRDDVRRVQVRMRGCEVGVSDILERDVVGRAALLLETEPSLRAFCSLFYSALASQPEADILLAAPRQLAAPGGGRVLGLVHSAALAHDIGAMRECIVDSICAPEPELSWASLTAPEREEAPEPSAEEPQAPPGRWYDPEPGLLNSPLHLSLLFCAPDKLGWEAYREVAQFIVDAMPFEALGLVNAAGESAATLAAAGGATEVLKQLSRRHVYIPPRAALLAAERGRYETLDILLGLALERCHLPDEAEAEQARSEWEYMSCSVLAAASRAAGAEEVDFDQFCKVLDVCCLRHGVDINAHETSQGLTALHVAAKEQNVVPLCAELIRRGAVPDALDRWGRRPVDYLSRRNDKGALRDVFAFWAAAPRTLKPPEPAARPPSLLIPPTGSKALPSGRLGSSPSTKDSASSAKAASSPKTAASGSRPAPPRPAPPRAPGKAAAPVAKARR
jgi:hypothetical protein